MSLETEARETVRISMIRSVRARRRQCSGPRMAKIIAAAIIGVSGVVSVGLLHCFAEAAAPTNADDHNDLMQLVAADKPEWKIYRDPNLGIEFSHPSNRYVTHGCHFSKKCAALVVTTGRLDDYLVAFEVFDGALDTVAADHAVFQKDGNHWIAKGRTGIHPVEPLWGSGWRGLKSVVDCGISDSNGFHAGAGECLWVVVSNGKRSIVADTQGTAPIDADIMRSILSLRFSVP
jgi:hypothetical protein